MTRTGDVVRTGVRGLGEIMITLGLILLLFTFYELQVTGLVTAREQGRLSDDLASSWAEPSPSRGQSAGAGTVAAEPTEVALGSGLAVLRVPRLGDFNDSPPVVVEGVSVEDLKKGPGHIPGTAMPGEVGNVVLSGHRTTYGQPFNAFGELRPGDAVVQVNLADARTIDGGAVWLVDCQFTLERIHRANEVSDKSIGWVFV